MELPSRFCTTTQMLQDTAQGPGCATSWVTAEAADTYATVSRPPRSSRAFVRRFIHASAARPPNGAPTLRFLLHRSMRMDTGMVNSTMDQ